MNKMKGKKAAYPRFEKLNCVAYFCNEIACDNKNIAVVDCPTDLICKLTCPIILMNRQFALNS